MLPTTSPAPFAFGPQAAPRDPVAHRRVQPSRHTRARAVPAVRGRLTWRRSK
ncbi:MAG: hypothetical protein HGA65_15215 [Oscillochloris sp.]|nr:hypothetical protein [Oscillochloris sp.]